MSTVTANDDGKEPGMECCDVRLTTVRYDSEQGNPDKSRVTTENYPDVVFFRLGHFMYQMLNQKYMVQKYNSTQWYEVDILINWGDETIEKSSGDPELTKQQFVQIFIDGTFLAQEPFFNSERIGASNSRANKIKSANALMLYGLSPGAVSRFKDVKVCIERCPGSENLKFIFARMGLKVLSLLSLSLLSLVYTF